MAISRNSKLRDCLAVPEAVEVIEKYFPNFVEEKASQLGPVMGMKIGMLLKFPQVGLPKDAVEAILKGLDELGEKGL